MKLRRRVGLTSGLVGLINDGHLVALSGEDVAVQGIVTCVELAVLEPLHIPRLEATARGDAAG